MSDRLKVFSAKRTLLCRVHSDELSLQLLKLLLSSREAADQREHNLLELRQLLVLNEVFLYVQLDVVVLRFLVLNLADPGMRGDCGSRHGSAAETHTHTHLACRYGIMIHARTVHYRLVA